ncbi:lysine N(6)-hydroxylase/L-ornithine N(5)-oxygenase family protein [uncultured Streptomyces sp.]|uniref:lysine N(6)-hydroxylase/L-ornithine N(5)-oxygenase family protein n=1 Tax=uncultured Streptomyces sp. TaxID=174707 RepID=UPI00262EB186|nr:SidA/IucD/PvdA family monooxygenase [uncultured Streptomyces sp.]
MAEEFPGGTDVLDVVGIGFGPSNLALAIALAEHNAAVPEADRVSAQFYEKQAAFGWHRGMLLDDTTMQVSHLKDLVTLRNPTSRFTFLAYLHDRGRLADFINHKIIFPSRVEFHDYLEWAAAAFQKEVAYGTEAVDVRPVEQNGEVGHFEVTAHSGALPSKPFVQRARNVVVACGLRPHLPGGATLSDRIWHTGELLDRLGRLPSPRPRSFTVVGAGQSGAEAVAHLHHAFPGADVHAVFSGYGYSPADDSSFVNRVFDPGAVDLFHGAPEDVKRMMLDRHRSTNYSVVDLDLIDELYRRVYQEKVRGHERLHVHGLTRLVEARTTGDSVRVTVEFLATGERRLLDTDVLVHATGYRPADPREVLPGLAPHLLTDEHDRVRVRRDYRVETGLRGPAAVYLQGATEHSHGLGSSLLSNTAVRAGEIGRAITGGGSRDAGPRKGAHA